MESTLKCEVCGQGLRADFSNNVWCINRECLVYDKCYSHDFIAARAEQKANNEPVQQKERWMQGSGFDKVSPFGE